MFNRLVTPCQDFVTIFGFPSFSDILIYFFILFRECEKCTLVPPFGKAPGRVGRPYKYDVDKSSYFSWVQSIYNIARTLVPFRV